MAPRSNLHPVFQQILEPLALGAHPRQGQPEAPHLRPHPDRPEVLIEDTPDGPDYLRICDRHQWASCPMLNIPYRPCCPLCEAEADAEPGRQRYRLLHARLARGGGESL